MKRRIALICLLLTTLWSNSSFAQQSRVVVDEFAISNWVTANRDALKIPSIAVGIIGPDKSHYLEGYGHAGLSQPYLLGELSQSVTALAVMLLVHDKTLALTDPASKWVSGVPSEVTITHLLHQTSGLDRASAASPWVDDEKTIDTVVAEAKFGPVGEFAYSSLNYQLLGRVVEKASGKPYADFVHSRIFEPAGMKTASARAEAPEAHVNGHQYMFGFPQALGEPDYNPSAIPSTFIWMSAEDMVHWIRIFTARGKLNGKQVFPGEVIETLLAKPVDSDYAMGWLYQSAGPSYAKHTGVTGAYTSAMAVMPDREFGVFVLTNLNSWMGIAPTNILNGVMSAMLGTEKQSVTNIEFVARLVFGVLVALILFTFLFELARWIRAKFPLALLPRERLGIGATVAINVGGIVAVVLYFQTPLGEVLATQPDIGIGLLIAVVLGSVRRVLTGFNKTLLHRALTEDV